MSKNSIGQFIAALRKANGMTQQDIADRLNVSNKAVSRWERDECAPDLTLIPALAEMFGVTCDELLRGERISRDAADSEEKAEKQKSKSERQFRAMVRRRERKYSAQTLISVGITIVGLIAAMIANLGFLRALIAFCIATAFIVASEICQIIFASNARIVYDEDDDAHADAVDLTNTRITKKAVVVTIFNAAVFAFCLPLFTTYAYIGFPLKVWLLIGLPAAAVVIFILSIVYSLFVKPRFIASGMIALDPDESARTEKNRRTLLKVTAVALAIALLLGLAEILIPTLSLDYRLSEKLVFDTCGELKEYMEKNYNDLVAELEKDGIYGLPERVDETIRNSKGEVICEFYRSDIDIFSIQYSESDDRMPATVITEQAHDRARSTVSAIRECIYLLMAVDVSAAALIYVIKRQKRR